MEDEGGEGKREMDRWGGCPEIHRMDGWEMNARSELRRGGREGSGQKVSLNGRLAVGVTSRAN